MKNSITRCLFFCISLCFVSLLSTAIVAENIPPSSQVCVTKCGTTKTNTIEGKQRSAMCRDFVDLDQLVTNILNSQKISPQIVRLGYELIFSILNCVNTFIFVQKDCVLPSVVISVLYIIFIILTDHTNLFVANDDSVNKPLKDLDPEIDVEK